MFLKINTQPRLNTNDLSGFECKSGELALFLSLSFFVAVFLCIYIYIRTVFHTSIVLISSSLLSPLLS